MCLAVVDEMLGDLGAIAVSVRLPGVLPGRWPPARCDGFLRGQRVVLRQRRLRTSQAPAKKTTVNATR